MAIRDGGTDPNLHDSNGDGAVSFADARSLVLLFDNPPWSALRALIASIPQWARRPDLSSSHPWPYLPHGHASR